MLTCDVENEFVMLVDYLTTVNRDAGEVIIVDRGYKIICINWCLRGCNQLVYLEFETDSFPRNVRTEIRRSI